MSDYKPQAIALVQVLGDLKDTLWDGVGIEDILPIFQALQGMLPLVEFIKGLDKSQYDEFIAECIDQAVGVEEHALVDEIAWLSPEQVEQVSDGLKTVILVVLNRDS